MEPITTIFLPIHAICCRWFSYTRFDAKSLQSDFFFKGDAPSRPMLVLFWILRYRFWWNNTNTYREPWVLSQSSYTRCVRKQYKMIYAWQLAYFLDWCLITFTLYICWMIEIIVCFDCLNSMFKLLKPPLFHFAFSDVICLQS